MIYADIQPVRDIYSNCAQNVLMNILQWKGECPDKLYSTGWSFFYDERCHLREMGERVNVYRSEFRQLEECLKSQYGVEIIWHRGLASGHSRTLIDHHLSEGMPAGLLIDSYVCNWQKGYGTYHSSHMIVVIGKHEEGFLCIDPYVSNKIELLNFSDFSKGMNGLFTFIFHSRYAHVVWGEALKKTVQDTLIGIEGIDDFQRMRLFSRELLNRQHLLKEEFHYDNVAYVPIIRKTSHIAFGRKSYSLYLRGLAEAYNLQSMQAYVEDMDNASKKWSKISSLFMKYGISGFNPEIISRIALEVNEAADLEERLAYSFLESGVV